MKDGYFSRTLSTARPLPREFDVHPFIFSEDAPTLESQIHKHFVLNQVNKVNHRKEFFRADLSHIRQEIEKLGLAAKWTMAAAAAGYRETQLIEVKIKDNPALREAWVNRQLQMELLEHETPAHAIQVPAAAVPEPVGLQA